MPALGSDRVYIVDVKTDPRKPRLDKVRSTDEKKCERQMRIEVERLYLESSPISYPLPSIQNICRL